MTRRSVKAECDVPKDFERRLSRHYGALSQRQQQAGDYIVANPLDTASRSLRAVAEDSGIAPATFSRLARALDYRDFEELRETMRAQIGTRVSGFAARADTLREAKGQAVGGFIAQACARATDNITALATNLDQDQLDTTAARLAGARNVLLVGGLGSTGIAEYACYMGDFLRPNWRQAGRMGSSIGAAVAELSDEDAVIVITKPPYATSSIRAAAAARAAGAYLVVISASHTCPALAQAHAGFIVPSEGQNFFTSYVASVFLLETLIALVAQHSGPDVAARITEIEEHSRTLGEITE